MTDSSVSDASRELTYASRVDLWIAIMLLMTPVIASAMGIYAFNEGEQRGAMVLFAMAGGTLLVTLAFTFPCRYTIRHDSLAVRCGIIAYRIPLVDIVEIEPSSTLQSGPALSMRRVVVATKHRHHVLSPRDREEFMDELKAACKRAKEQ